MSSDPTSPSGSSAAQASSAITGSLVGRMAPTPSGELHIGNIFSFLCAWLSIRKRNGRIILRMEDLDKPRCKKGYADAILHDLEALGLYWDNEEIVYQSKREGYYIKALVELFEQRVLYECFCSRSDIQSASAPHEGDTSMRPYRDPCRYLAEWQVNRFRMSRRYALRCKMPDYDLAFVDLIQGPQHFNLARDCGDFIVKRRDGLFSYQFSVTVDDIDQGVTEVIRGWDLLSSTPIQMYLRCLLTHSHLEEAAHICSYGHVPLLVDEQGKRLSKRDGSLSLEGLLERFGDVRHLLGHLAWRTGLIPEEESMGADDLIRHADLSKLSGQTHVIWPRLSQGLGGGFESHGEPERRGLPGKAGS